MVPLFCTITFFGVLRVSKVIALCTTDTYNNNTEIMCLNSKHTQERSKRQSRCSSN